MNHPFGVLRRRFDEGLYTTFLVFVFPMSGIDVIFRVWALNSPRFFCSLSGVRMSLSGSLAPEFFVILFACLIINAIFEVFEEDRPPTYVCENERLFQRLFTDWLHLFILQGPVIRKMDRAISSG